MTTICPIDLAEAVAEAGPEAHEDDLRDLVAEARCAECCPSVVLDVPAVVLDVVADPTAPPVARQRALGRLVAAIAPSGRTSRLATTVRHEAVGRSAVHQERDALRGFFHP